MPKSLIKLRIKMSPDIGVELIKLKVYVMMLNIISCALI